MSRLDCRFCQRPLVRTFVDLGMSPLANAYPGPEDLGRSETFYPLHTYVCEECFLVQLPEVASPEEIFRDYAYFSSTSESWLEHARAYAAAMVERFALGSESQVVEVASNDGYLLRFFQEREIPVLGIEPAANVARAAEARGIRTLTKFFGEELARRLEGEGVAADLLVANNVLAHTPCLNDFVAGLKILLAPRGVITLEFPHLLRLIDESQFDTIYHEHFSYFSFTTVGRVLKAHGLEVLDVQELPTHGGSLRLYARHAGEGGEVAIRVGELLAREEQRGFATLAPYEGFAEKAKAAKRGLLAFLLAAAERGESLVGYGAPAKGNTFLNYCGIRQDFLPYTVDRSRHKQGRFLPGTRIPIHAPEKVRETRPDYLWILPWNLREEIMEQMAWIREWGGRFLVAIPEVRVLP